ncbi:MAG: CoA transferase, partial [Chloroflexi bacterium]|nr:CoA transferase [Chloroflexota bacterium]
MLRDIRVVDLSRAIAGPYCTMLLGDFGADVVKVEPPNGDMARVAGLSRKGDQATYFLAVNSNKRSIVIDLRTDTGRDGVWLTFLQRLAGDSRDGRVWACHRGRWPRRKRRAQEPGMRARARVVERAEAMADGDGDGGARAQLR